MSAIPRFAFFGLLLAWIASESASAQVVPSNIASIEAGYGGARSIETAQFAPSTRDANGNRVVLNGALQQGSANTSLTQGDTLGSGAAFFSSGAQASSSATAIGNLLSVSIAGSGNTVIIDNRQINKGAINAAAAVNASGAGAQSR